MFPSSAKRQQGSETLCSKCHEPHYDFVLAFPELDGLPAICARCVYEALTGTRPEWHKSIYHG